MASKQMTMHMNQGLGETSYARNSGIQSSEQNRMRPFIEAAITDLLCNSTSMLLPAKMVIADLGCSSGPNAIALALIAIKAIRNHCLELQQPPPEVCVLLNDLPDNDFNTVVKSLVTLRQSNEPIIITGVVPGSFYERLFSSGSLHLNYMFIQQPALALKGAPEDLTRNQIPAYDFDEHARRERLTMVTDAYAQQFRKDLTLFLQLRAKELVRGGRMVVSLVGRRSGAPATEFSYPWEIVTRVLSAMVSESVIDKAKFNSFYVPLYASSDEEVRAIIREEGSFFIREMELHNPLSGLDKALVTPSGFANIIRAVYEPMIVHYFGEVMNEFMRTADRLWRVEGRLEDDFASHPIHITIISLSKA